MSMIFEARVWKFPDNVNTDLIMQLKRVFHYLPAGGFA